MKSARKLRKKDRTYQSPKWIDSEKGWLDLQKRKSEIDIENAYKII